MIKSQTSRNLAEKKVRLSMQIDGVYLARGPGERKMEGGRIGRGVRGGGGEGRGGRSEGGRQRGGGQDFFKLSSPDGAKSF